MPLVIFKNLLVNLFYKQDVSSIPTRGVHQPLLPSGRSASIGSDLTANDGCVDVESQLSKNSGFFRGFKVDGRIVSDATIGLSDGLTVPFALTAGLSALGNTKVVVYGGLAELIAGAISMGVGGYLGAKSEAASYNTQRLDIRSQVDSNRQAALSNVDDLFEPFGVPPQIIEALKGHLEKAPSESVVDFVMKFEHCANEPAASRPLTSGATIAISYLIGGLVPLAPYFFVGSAQVYEGLYISIGVMVIALFIFGYVKTCVVVGWEGHRNIRGGCWGGVQLVCIGGLAAACAMGLVKAFDQISDL